ncbi:MAG: glycosyltransferase, partial [Chloroflexota bacterium]
DPGHLDAGNDLAALYFARGLYDEARAILQRLAAAHPQDERTRDNLTLLDKASAESGPVARLPLRTKDDRQTVSLCMIVRDEEANLPGCLESVRDLADEVIVVDTGSTDRTVQVAESFGAKAYYFPWCNDFAAARNESLLRATGDWILYLDADERLEDGGCQKIRELVDAGKYDAYSLEIRNVKSDGSGEADTTHTYSRLFRNRPDVRFEGTVHEQIYPALYRAAMEVGPADVRIVHLGYDLSEEEMKRKAERNLPMLLLQRRGFPNDLLVRVNLANAYLMAGHSADAMSEFRAAVATPSPEYHARAYAYLMIAELLLNHEKDPEGAMTAARAALELNSDLIGPRLVLAEAAIAKGDYPEAIAELKEVVRLGPLVRPSPHRIDQVKPKDWTLKMLGACQFKVGQYADAADSLKEGCAAGHPNAPTCRLWAAAAAWAGRHRECADAFGKGAELAAGAREKAECLYQQGLAEYVAGDLPATERSLQAAVTDDPSLQVAADTLAKLQRFGEMPTVGAESLVDERLRLLRLKREVAETTEDWRGLATTLGELFEAGEEPYVVFLEMGRTMGRLGRPSSAVSYLERALSLNPKSSEGWRLLGRYRSAAG